MKQDCRNTFKRFKKNLGLIILCILILALLFYLDINKGYLNSDLQKFNKVIAIITAAFVVFPFLIFNRRKLSKIKLEQKKSSFFINSFISVIFYSLIVFPIVSNVGLWVNKMNSKSEINREFQVLTEDKLKGTVTLFNNSDILKIDKTGSKEFSMGDTVEINLEVGILNLPFNPKLIE